MREKTADHCITQEVHPSDAAEMLARSSPETARRLLNSMPAEQAALALAELDNAQAASLLEGFAGGQIASWLQFLSPSNVADILFGLSPECRSQTSAALPNVLLDEVAKLLGYRPDSAGGLMDNRFIAVRSGITAEECLAVLRSNSGKRMDDVLYIYVTDDAEKLVGVLSLRELVFAPAEHRIQEIMHHKVKFLRVHDDQEEVARQMQHYHFLGFPVVDGQGRLVGVVKARDAIRIAEAEATEDMQLMVGLSGAERIWTPWTDAIAKRMPWLGVNLFTALGASMVVSLFESTLSRWTALVAFLPLICAIAGNAGNQALTVIIRSFALGEVAPGDKARALKKELFLGLANGSALALAIGFIAFTWKGSVMLAVVAGSAMLINQVIGAMSGVAIPFLLKWFKVDPALASSILVTALTDTIGFLVFLGTATFAMQTMG